MSKNQSTHHFFAKIIRDTWLIAVLLVLATCSRSSSVVINISGITDDVQSLRVRVFFGNQAGRPQVLDRTTTKVVFDVPESAQGAVAVVVTGRGASTCNISRAEQQVDLSVSRLSYPVLDLALTPLPGPKESTCTLGIYLDSLGTSAKVSETGNNCSEQSPRDCDVDFNRGNAASVTGFAGIGNYLTFTGTRLCAQECKIIIDQGTELSGNISTYIKNRSGWTWYNPLPQGASLNAVWGSGPENIWAGGQGGLLMYWNGKRWFPYWSPAGEDITSITGFGTSSAWATDKIGNILRSNGTCPTPDTCWTIEKRTSPLTAIAAVSDKDVWATGQSGEILHSDGSTWSTWPQTGLSCATGWTPRAIWADANAVIIVGNAGKIARITSTAATCISTASSPPTGNLVSIWGNGKDRDWVLSDKGEIYELRIDKVMKVQGPLNGQWTSIFGVSDNEVYAVGVQVTKLPSGDNLLDPYINKWNGVTWSSSSWNIGYPVKSLWGDGSNGIWGVGDFGQMVTYDGRRWSQFTYGLIEPAYVTPTGLIEVRLQSVWGSGSDNMWFVGDLGTIFHWNGSSLTKPLQPEVPTVRLRSVHGSDRDNVWVVGHPDSRSSGSPSSLFKMDGERARNTNQMSATSTLGGGYYSSVYAQSKTSVLAVGIAPTDPSYGLICKWDGQRWGCSTSDLSDRCIRDIYSVSVVPDGRVLYSIYASNATAMSPPCPMMAKKQVVLQNTSSPGLNTYFPNPNATALSPDPTEFVRDIFQVGAGEGYLVGDNGYIGHYSSSTITKETVPLNPNQFLTGVWATGASDVWAVGSSDTIFHKKSTGWESVPTGAFSYVQDIWGASARDLWIVGAAGMILRYQQ